MCIYPIAANILGLISLTAKCFILSGLPMLRFPDVLEKLSDGFHQVRTRLIKSLPFRPLGGCDVGLIANWVK